jgi:hypothetical protein
MQRKSVWNWSDFLISIAGFNGKCVGLCQLSFRLEFYRNTDLFYSCNVAYAAAAYVFSNTFDSYASSKYKRVRSLIITTSPYTESPTDVFQQLGFFEIPTYFIVATSHTLLLLLIYFQHLGFLWDSYASSKSRTKKTFWIKIISTEIHACRQSLEWADPSTYISATTRLLHARI